MNLLETRDVAGKRAAMFSGETINETEGRAVFHVALRDLDDTIEVDGQDVITEVRATLARMEALRKICARAAIRAGRQDHRMWSNIGIGGSDSWPCNGTTIAMAPFHDGPRCHFVSNASMARIFG